MSDKALISEARALLQSAQSTSHGYALLSQRTPEVMTALCDTAERLMREHETRRLMTTEQHAEFERRIIQRAFEAGVCGCDADPVVCDVADAMGLGESVEYEEWVEIFRSLVARGILREEGAIPADFLALSYEEWGRRIASSMGFPGYVNIADMIAKMLRGKQEKI